jgi:hypothetical protein
MKFEQRFYLQRPSRGSPEVIEVISSWVDVEADPIVRMWDFRDRNDERSALHEEDLEKLLHERIERSDNWPLELEPEYYQ